MALMPHFGKQVKQGKRRSQGIAVGVNMRQQGYPLSRLMQQFCKISSIFSGNIIGRHVYGGISSVYFLFFNGQTRLPKSCSAGRWNLPFANNHIRV
jgi:hypothetical protein